MKKIPFEYKITLTYIILGALWILFSDELLYTLTNDPQRFQTFSTYKGWFFILVTGILLFILIKNEIKRRNILYNQLLEAKKKADEADRLKTAFLANISHYIRTPMNGILGFIELLENKNTSPEKHQLFLKYVNDRSEMLLQTLNNIIEISKIQEGQHKIEKSSFGLKVFLNEMLLSAKAEVSQNKEIVLNPEYNSKPEIEIFTDKKILNQIVLHLVSNAVKFTQKGAVVVDFTIDENYIVIKVQDSGPGVSAEAQKILFYEFMYNSGHSYSLGEGAGLGLFLSNKLAQLINGTLWLENTSNSGSTFCFKFPVQ